jgi:hypothetical protein
MKYVDDTEITVTVAYKIKAIKGDAKALQQQLRKAYIGRDYCYGSFTVETEDIYFEEFITTIEYDFNGIYSEKLIDSVEEFIDEQVSIFENTKVTA